MSDAGLLRVQVLCEDSEHEAFARRVFERWHGVGRRRVKVTKAPQGKGAASQWVTEQLADLARKVRANRHQQRLIFLAVTDGDNLGFSGRKEQLESNAPREPGDRLAIWAPTWSIETWVLWLSQTQVKDRPVDEHQSFKTALPAARFRELLDDAVEAWNSPHPGEADSIPSLTDARGELEQVV